MKKVLKTYSDTVLKRNFNELLPFCCLYRISSFVYSSFACRNVKFQCRRQSHLCAPNAVVRKYASSSQEESLLPRTVRTREKCACYVQTALSRRLRVSAKTYEGLREQLSLESLRASAIPNALLRNGRRGLKRALKARVAVFSAELFGANNFGDKR